MAEEEARIVERYVFITDLAEFFNLERSSFTRKMKGKKLSFKKLRHPQSRQMALAVSVDDAKKIIEDERGGPEIVKPEDLV